jgi:hypothetical protein
MNFEDCEKYMEQYASYDEKIVKGLITQVYYHVSSYQLVRDIDEELDRIASEYGGFQTGEQGLRHGKRDLDFEFQSVEDARNYTERISSTLRFHVLQDKINVMGHLIDKPSILEIEERKKKLKSVNCGPDKCDLVQM